MKKETLLEFALWAVLIVPFLYLALVWNQLPEMVPTHFNARGEPDDYSGKNTLVGMLAAFMFLPALLLKYVPQLDPRRKPEDFGDNFRRLRLVLSVFMAAIGVIMVRAGIERVDIALVMPVLLGGLFAGIGNYISTAKSNYFVGIRTPWTLENEDVWRKTHRLGGRVMFWSGIACIGLSFLLPAAIRVPVVLALLVLSSLAPVVYSYVAYRQMKG